MYLLAALIFEFASTLNLSLPICMQNGNTPLYEAVWNNQADTVDLFLNGDADVNIRNKVISMD